jgi:hypothetical protein
LIVGCVSHTVHRMIGGVLGGDLSLFHVRMESINIERYRRVHGGSIESNEHHEPTAQWYHLYPD